MSVRICAWVGFPLGLPVAVYLPVGAGEAVVVGFAPLADCVVRGAKAAIGAEMCCRCHGARYAGASWLADHGCDFDLYQPIFGCERLDTHESCGRRFGVAHGL